MFQHLNNLNFSLNTRNDSEELAFIATEESTGPLIDPRLETDNVSGAGNAHRIQVENRNVNFWS